MSDQFNLTLGDYGEDEAELKILEDTLSGFGMSVDDVLQLEQEVNADAELNLLYDESDDDFAVVLEDEQGSEEERLTSASLLRSSADIVEEFVFFANYTKDLLAMLTPKRVDDEDIVVKFPITRSDFSYMPDDVFRVFHRILIDLAAKEEFQGYSAEECVDASLEILNSSVRWTPNLNGDDYSNSFIMWHQRFRRLAGTKGRIDDSDLSTLVDMDELKVTHEVFTVNSTPFILANRYLSDPVVLKGETPVNPQLYGMLCHERLSKTGAKVLTIADVRTVVLEYLGSADFAKTLRLSTDELLTYSVGELLRRCLLYELDNAIFYPAALTRVKPDSNYNILGDVIYKDLSNSISAEILCLLITMMRISTKKRMPRILSQFKEAIYQYLYDYVTNPILAHPVMYGNVIHRDGKYILGYADREKTGSIESDDPLCKIIGTKHNQYYYPRVIFDEENYVNDTVRGYVVCPSKQLLDSLRIIPKTGRTRVTGGMKFQFCPNVGWLISNKISAEDKDARDTDRDTGISGEANELLQMLLSYDNKFVTSEAEVMPSALHDESHGIIIYMVPGVNAESGDIIAAIATATDVPRPIGRSGVLVGVENSIVVQYNDLYGKIADITVEREHIQNQNALSAGDGSKDGATSPASALESFFAVGTTNTAELDSYQSAVMQLCEMATLDYQEELEFIQQVISRDLFYLVGVPSLDGILATLMLQSYQKLWTEQGTVDKFNLPSLQELTDILIGKPNGMEGVEEFNDECKQYLEGILKSESKTIQSVCAELDTLNLDVLALQILSVNQISRTPDLEAYLAYRSLPGVGERMRLLENKMIVLRAFSLLKEQSVTVFTKFNPLTKVYSEEITLQTVDSMHEVLREKMHRKLDIGGRYSLPLVKEIVGKEFNPDTVMLKYFALERDAYSFIMTLQGYGEKYRDLANKLLESLGMKANTQLVKVSPTAFRRDVSKNDVERMFSHGMVDIKPLLLQGFISETISSGYFQVTRAYDLFNTFYKILIGRSEFALPESSIQELYNYAASFVISYAPAFGPAANAIDGGTDRISAFADNSDDFYAAFDLEPLRQYKMHDLRLIVGGE